MDDVALSVADIGSIGVSIPKEAFVFLRFERAGGINACMDKHAVPVDVNGWKACNPLQMILRDVVVV